MTDNANPCPESVQPPSSPVTVVSNSIYPLVTIEALKTAEADGSLTFGMVWEFIQRRCH